MFILKYSSDFFLYLVFTKATKLTTVKKNLNFPNLQSINMIKTFLIILVFCRKIPWAKAKAQFADIAGLLLNFFISK